MRVEVPDYETSPRVAVDPTRTALIVVDMQKDFVLPDGALPIESAATTVPIIAGLRELAGQHDMPVFFTQDSHEIDDPEVPIWGPHCVVDTPGWAIVDDLAPEDGDGVIPKDRYDGFHGTDLDERLRARGIDTLIICGTVANICVLSTASSAALRWYHVVLPVDAISAITDFDLQLTIRQVEFLFRGTITTAAGIVVEE